MQYNSFTPIWVRIVFLFHPFKAIFLSPRTMAFFHCYHRRQLTFISNLSISLSLTSVTTRLDRCYHQQFNPKPSYFHHLADGRLAAFNEEASPNENAKRTNIHLWSIVPRGRLARGSVPQIIWYIYTPHQNCLISRDAKQILPVTGDATALARERMPGWSLLGGWGLGGCLFTVYAATRGQ